MSLRGNLLKQPRREIVEGVTPGLPFVGQPLGLAEHHVLDAGLLQRLVQGLGTLVDALLEAGGAGVEVQQAHLFVERGGIGEHATVGRFHIDPAASAERTDGRKGIGVGQADPQGLGGTHGQPGNRPLLPVGDRPVL